MLPPQPIDLLVVLTVIMTVNAVVSRLARRHLETRIPELRWLATAEARSRTIQRASPLFRIASSSSAMCLMALLVTVPLHILLQVLLRLNTLNLGLFLAGYVVVLIVIALTVISVGARRIRKQVRYQLADRGMPVCRICGYDLSGQVATRCPECGHDFDADQLPDAGAALVAPVALSFDYSDDVLHRGLAVLWSRAHGRRLLWGTTTSCALLVWLVPTCGNHWLVGAIGCLTVLSAFQLLRGRSIFTRRVIADWGQRPSRNVEIAFDNNGVECHTALSTLRVAWNQCRRLYRSKHMWLLFVTDNEPLLLPTSLLGEQTMSFITSRMQRAGVEVS